MNAKFIRGGYWSGDCWGWEVYAADGACIDTSRSWWLMSADAQAELDERYPGLIAR